jgi:hypothetical protein
MASCHPAGGNSRKENNTKRWATARSWIAIASLVSFLAVSFGAAIAVAGSGGDPNSVYAAPAPAADTSAAEPVSATTSSSTLKGPKTAASSWSMSPLPEGEGGAVSSSTQLSPVTEHSSLVAAPR